MTMALARRRQRTVGSGPETGTNYWFGTARSHHGDSESPRRRGCEARGNPKVWGTLSLGTWLLAIEPTVRSSARSSKGRLSECQRSLTRMTSTVKAEGLRREIVNRDESARGDTKPKSSNRAKTAWLMARRGAREEGSSPDLSVARRCPHPRETSGARTRVVRGEREDAEGGDAGMG